MVFLIRKKIMCITKNVRKEKCFYTETKSFRIYIKMVMPFICILDARLW